MNGLLATGWKFLHHPPARESPFRTHFNAPLTPTGRLRMVLRHLEDGVPKAHMAAEFRGGRPTLTIWVARYLDEGVAGLADRPPRPWRSPQRTPAAVVELIKVLRPKRNWSVRRIHRHLLGVGHELHLRTVGRWLARLEISRLRYLTPDSDDLRRPPQRIQAGWPGYMVHLDVKKVGRIRDGGGWFAHGRGSAAAKQFKCGIWARADYTYLRSAVGGFWRLAYTEALADEKVVTTIGFFCRARVFLAAHGIHQLHRMVTDNGANYRAKDFTRCVEALAVRGQANREVRGRRSMLI